MSDQLSPDEIERESEVERAALARSLNELQRQETPEVLVERVSNAVRHNGGEFAQSAIRQAQANPLALAITGAGLAWLMAGPAAKRTTERPVRVPVTTEPSRRVVEPTPVKPKVGYDDRSRTTVRGFRRSAEPESFKARVARAETNDYDPAIRPIGGRMSNDEMENRDSSKSLRDRLMEGTENMTDAARDRVMAAREAAIIAERRIEARARDYGLAGKEAFNSQPLMGALVAFGVGALAGALVPRTRVEDRHLGAARDRAMLEAERIYRTETARLRHEAEAFAEDVVTTAGEAVRGSDRPGSETSGTTDKNDRAFN